MFKYTYTYVGDKPLENNVLTLTRVDGTTEKTSTIHLSSRLFYMGFRISKELKQEKISHTMGCDSFTFDSVEVAEMFIKRLVAAVMADKQKPSQDEKSVIAIFTAKNCSTEVTTSVLKQFL